MAVTDQQKLDFLLKKIGYTKTKTGSVVGTGAISGTPKQPFAEAIPSPLVVPNASLWNEADSIPATAPGADTTQVKVYLAGTSGLRMTADSTSSGQRAFIAYTTYNNTSSARLTNWIDTQFGSSYLIKVYKGDPNSGGVALSAAGSGSNDGWFFDYSAGVLNFNDTSVPSGVTDTNIYIVGYRYVGQTGAPTSGISTFSYLDLTVERNLDVGVQGGISTFRNNIDANGIIEGIAGENKIPFLYSNLAALPNAGTYHGMFAHVHSEGRGYFAHAGNWLELVNKDTSGNVGLSGDLDVDGHTNLDNISVAGVSTFTGDATFAGNVSIGGTLTYEDVTNVDSVGLLTARSGIRVTGGVIEALAGENKIPSLYANMGALPAAGSYHGMFAHVHSTGRGYFAHAGNWLELVNKETNGVVGTGTETYNIGNLVSVSSTATSLNVTGVTTAVTVDINGDLDVDGHTNLDNVSVAGVTTFAQTIKFPDASGGIGSANAPVAIFGTNSDLKIGHDSSSSRIFHNGAGNLIISSNNSIKLSSASTGHDLLRATAGGSVLLRHNNSSKLETTGVGVTIFGNTETQTLNVTGVTTAVTVDVNGDLDVDGHTNLDNVNIVGVTTAAGHILPATDSTYDLGSSSKYWRHVYADNVTGGGGGVIIGDDIITRNLKVNGISTFTGNIDANGDLDVDGHTNLDNVSIAGVTTFTGTAEFDGTAKFDSTITAGGATGSNGQYLKTTGTGVAWATFPTLRTRDTIVASAGQTSFTFNYTVNFIDVYVNGIKLTDSEFTATNGTSIVLAVGCFVGDIVEFVSYNTVSSGGGGGGGTLNNIVEDTSPQLGGNLDLFSKTINGSGGINITGVVTATTFIGDGSGLTGITASGTGVVIRNNDTTVGTAGTINFGNNLSVTPIVAGIVTITGSIGITTNSGVVSIANDLDVDGHTNLDNVSIAGIVTVTKDLDVDGHTNLDNVNIVGVTTHTGQTRFYGNGNAPVVWGNTGYTGHLTYDGSDNAIIRASSGKALIFQSDHVNTRMTIGSQGNVSIEKDLDVDGHTELDNVNVAGVVTATTFKGAVQATSGTFSSGVDITGDIDVDGHTNLDNVSIAGFTTITQDLDVDGHTNLDNVSIAGFTTITQDLDVDGHTNLDNVSVAGVVTATSFSGSGANLTNVVASNITLTANNDSLVYRVPFASANTGTTALYSDGDITYNPNSGTLSATAFTGDGSGLTNVSSSGISTTNLRADTIVVGENTTGVSTFHRVQIPTDKTLFFGDSLNAYISYQSSQNYLYLYGGIGGDMVIQTGGNRAIKLEASGVFEAYTGSNKIAIKASTNGVELYQGTSPTLRFATTGVGVTVVGITSMTDNLMVGTNATITPAGAAQFAGIVTASSFVGDGSGLTGITASGTGIVIKEAGSTVGTAGTINFVGVDVTPASAGIVTVSTATTSITDGNSKLFVNNVSSSNGNGSFEVFLNEFTYGGTRQVLNMYQPTDGYARIDLHHGTLPTTVEINAKTVYSGSARHRLKFETNNSGYGGQLDFITPTGSWNFYSTYQNTQKNVMSFNYNSVGVGNYMYPITNNAFDLGSSSYKWRQFHTTGVNAGVVTATTYHGDGSNLTGISGSQNVFQTIAVSGQSNVVADSTTDTLTLVAGSNMTITTNAGSDTITLASSGSTPATSDIQVVYEITNQSSFSYFRFAGNGVDSSANNPDIYLTRGQKYRFINNSGGSHPFQIQTTGGSAYTTGVTYTPEHSSGSNSASSGNIDFAIRWDAPSQLKYVCTSHGSMVGNIYIDGGDAERRTTANAATGSIANAAAANISITAAKTYSLLKVQTSAAAWVTLYTDSTSRSNDASRGETTDPTPGSGVIAEVITSGSATQILSPGVIGWNNDSTPASTVYAKVVNKSGSTQAITVTLHYLAMEI